MNRSAPTRDLPGLHVHEEPADLDVVLWSSVDAADEGPSGAAAALAVMAFMGFVSGLALAAVLLL